MRIKNYFSGTQATRDVRRKAVGSHDDHDNFDGSPTPPEHPPQATHNLKPPSTWEASMVSNSNVWSKRNNSYDSTNILRGNPTKISPPPSNAAVDDILVDDDTRPPQPNNTAPNLARLQEWSDFQASFDDFLSGFAKFRKERGLLDTSPPTPAAATTTTEQRSPVVPQSFVESLESSSKSIENAPSFSINSKNKPPTVIQSPPSPALHSNRCTSHKFHVLMSSYYLPSCSLPLPPSLTYKRHYSVNLLGPHNLHRQQFTTLQLW